ncbi:hypothetical protein [Sulfurimonas sp.]|jgi:hypothetical protein|uniref:hypothetical protein n=1 Tax=Sulfurimonas sp. TaxID=2022749 RepID=UPI0025DE67F1|nr:hypothetical protein [Sulfurimonas sp.]MBT5935861.1 hypothetical protein [Sulfurimonas sp.]
MKFRRDTTTLFLDPASKEQLIYDTSKKVNIILSPSLYWVKKMSLPVTNVREVKKLLPSIFEDSLPVGHYSYTAYKHGEDFMLFAYEDKKILDLLVQHGISSVNTTSIHFAQSEFIEIPSAFCINEKQCMYLKGELLVLAPSEWISEKEKLNLDTVTLSKHTIKLQQFGHIVDNGSLYKIGALLSTLALILIGEIFITSVKKDTITLAQDELFTKYKLQSTMFQNRSSLNKYSKIHNRQTKFRESISYFLALKLKTNQKISLVAYKSNLLSVTISGVNTSSKNAIINQLNAKGIKSTTSLTNDKLKVEVKI